MVEGAHCRVAVAGSAPPSDLFCAARLSTFRGEKRQRIVPVWDGNAAVLFDEAPRTLSIHLITAGEVLDSFEENEFGSSWGRSVLNRNRIEIDSGYAILSEALLAGENDRIEFKSSIAAANRDNKSTEVLKSVVAFANARGGSVYIGVTDYGEPVGINRFLKDAYQKEAKGEITRMRDAYVRDLRKMINEGTDPAVDHEFHWIEVAKEQILRLDVTGNSSSIHSLIQTGEIYVRAGATNRKMRHADALALFAERLTQP